MHSSARIMRPGERILIHGVTMEVVDAGPRRVKLVRIWATPDAQPPNRGEALR
jgi:CBS domain containing-hemolysin-like protein